MDYEKRIDGIASNGYTCVSIPVGLSFLNVRNPKVVFLNLHFLILISWIFT